MNTLILYSTKHGAAKKCAEMLSKKLKGKVDMVNIKEGKVTELSQYDKVIIGGAIYVGRVSKELNEFCTKNLESLKAKKLGFYICCMNGKEAEKQINENFPSELLKAAAAKKSFGGEFKFKEMNIFEKVVTKMVSKVLSKEDPSLTIDMKKDLSMLSEKTMDEFVQAMNAAI
jgi:menaquinone-dependent protoporphyrinogen oxidase